MDSKTPDRSHAVARRIYWIFVAAAAVNIGGLGLASVGLTNDTLLQTDPTRFSRFGVVMVMIWGLTYLAAAKAAARAPELSLAFAAEKLAYVVSWVLWIGSADTNLSQLLDENLLAGLFYSTYGLIDLACLIGFLWSAHAARGLARAKPSRPGH